MTEVDEKVCASCGRRFAWRKKWAKNWSEVRYCSDACSRRKVTDLDRRLEATLLDGLRRGPVDPAMVARALGVESESARRAARRLGAAGQAELMQGGHAVDPTDVRGDFTVRTVQ